MKPAHPPAPEPRAAHSPLPSQSPPGETAALRRCALSSTLSVCVVARQLRGFRRYRRICALPSCWRGNVGDQRLLPRHEPPPRDSQPPRRLVLNRRDNRGEIDVGVSDRQSRPASRVRPRRAATARELSGQREADGQEPEHDRRVTPATMRSHWAHQRRSATGHRSSSRRRCTCPPDP